MVRSFRSTVRAGLAAGLLLSAAGCGRAGTDNATQAASGPAASGPTAPSGWKATDACALLDKSVVAATLGGTVKSADLSAVKSEGNGFPLYSQCGYLLEDGRMLVFGTGQYTNGMSLSEQVADMRRQAAIVSDSKPLDEPGLGKAALWASDVHGLYAFFGDGRYVSATITQTDFRKHAEPVEKDKADSIAILHKAGA